MCEGRVCNPDLWDQGKRSTLTIVPVSKYVMTMFIPELSLGVGCRNEVKQSHRIKIQGYMCE